MLLGFEIKLILLGIRYYIESVINIRYYLGINNFKLNNYWSILDIYINILCNGNDEIFEYKKEL